MSRALIVSSDEQTKNLNVALQTEYGETLVARGLSEEKLADFYRQKVKTQPPQILPPAVRWIASNNTALIWERPPDYYTINYTRKKQLKISAGRDSDHVFRIPVPWQVYVVGYNADYTVHTIYMFFRSEPLGHNLAGYAHPSMNFYVDGKLCMAQYDLIPDANNLYQMLSNVYDMIWNSGFNDDLNLLWNTAINSNTQEDHPLYSKIRNGPISPYEVYLQWSKLNLRDVVEKAQWVKLQDNVVELASEMSRKGGSMISTVQFVMDVGDIA